MPYGTLKACLLILSEAVAWMAAGVASAHNARVRGRGIHSLGRPLWHRVLRGARWLAPASVVAGGARSVEYLFGSGGPSTYEKKERKKDYAGGLAPPASVTERPDESEVLGHVATHEPHRQNKAINTAPRETTPPHHDQKETGRQTGSRSVSAGPQGAQNRGRSFGATYGDLQFLRSIAGGK